MAAQAPERCATTVQRPLSSPPVTLSAPDWIRSHVQQRFLPSDPDLSALPCPPTKHATLFISTCPAPFNVHHALVWHNASSSAPSLCPCCWWMPSCSTMTSHSFPGMHTWLSTPPVAAAGRHPPHRLVSFPASLCCATLGQDALDLLMLTPSCHANVLIIDTLFPNEHPCLQLPCLILSTCCGSCKVLYNMSQTCALLITPPMQMRFYIDPRAAPAVHHPPAEMKRLILITLLPLFVIPCFIWVRVKPQKVHLSVTWLQA